jgi:dihydropyrimidinase
VHGEDEDLVQFNYERFRHEGRMDGANMHLVHTKLSELLAFRRTVALAKAHSAAVYFVHTSAKEGVETIAEARGHGQPIYGETLHQYACFNAEYYKTPRGFCSHTYPSLKFPEDQEALWRGARARRPGHAGHRRVPDAARAEAARAHDRGRHRWQRGRRGAHGHRLQRGRGQARHDARALMPTSPRPTPRRSSVSTRARGAIAVGSDADLAFIDPRVRKTLVKETSTSPTTARGKAGA